MTEKIRKEDHQDTPERQDKRDRDEQLDEGLDESFPASDPPAITREKKPSRNK